MTATLERVTVTVADGDRLLARADVECRPDRFLARASLHVEAGHLPVGTRSRLVDAVLRHPDVVPCARLEVAMPAGEGEILERVRQACTEVETRRAGATCLLRATLRPAPQRRPNRWFVGR
jgi:hypothetical protein